MLDLNLKGYIEINIDKNKKGKDGIIIKLLKQEAEDLPENEKVLFRFLKMAMKNKEITMKELQNEISTLSSSIPKMVSNLDRAVSAIQEEKKNYNKEENEKKSKYSALLICYLIFGIMLLVWMIPIGILLLVNAFLCFKIVKKCNVLTQKGIDEKEKWQGLMKYMLDFSLLNEKEVPSIVVWEKYLVFATAFGIADKVLKQLKIVYPEIESMDAFSTASCIYIMSNTNFNSSFTSAMSSSFSSAMSSGSGSGGGFSGGGGGRRPVVEAGGGR